MKGDYKTVGIVGHLGMVGGTVYRYFKDKQLEVYGYDLREPKNKKKVFGAEIVFVCVPTPFDWVKNRYIDLAVESTLVGISPGRTVVIKSTVMIGTTEKLQNKYPQLKLLFNPEFLSEATADMDFRNPDRQFVGYTSESYKEATKVLNMLLMSPYDAIMPAQEAELLKYINNLHGVLEVLESNHYFEVCQKEGLDYERVIRAAVASKWVGCPMGRQYRVIKHRGYRGVGGKCFPKDLNAWLEYCHKNGIAAEIMTAARKMNRRILAEQKLTEKEAEKL